MHVEDHLSRASGPARALWAKSGQGDEWHPLIAHMLDTAAVAHELLLREPAYTRELYAGDLGLDRPSALPWICALAGFHDLGKASPAFQQKWAPGAARVRTQGLSWSAIIPPVDIPHGLITQWALEEILRDFGWALPAAQHAADAVGCHHGFRATPNELAIEQNARGDEPWAAVRHELVEAVLATTRVGHHAPAVERLSGAAFMRLAGLATVADWIASSLPFTALGDDLDVYYAGAQTRARAAMDGIGWQPRESLLAVVRPFETTFAYLGTRERPLQARPLQMEVERLLDAVVAPTLLLVEAPMGEGKTEVAFYAHLRLQAAMGHRGLYVALPTQATGNAMFMRAAQFLAAVGARRPIDLQLLHGATLLNDQYQAIQVRGNVPEDELQAVAAREWFSHKKRALLSEYGVGTVDQALLAVLNVKHQFVRLWGLANRTVVIDEVHAYDTYTSGLIFTLVRWLHALGSSVVVMTATLPAAKRRELLAAVGAGDAPEAPYPRLTRVAAGRTEVVSFQAHPQLPIRIEPAPADVAALVRLLADLARRGGCVACITNTVQRAQDLYQALRTSAVPLWLFHARYPVEERQRLEAQITALFGKDGARPERGILIATQVIEQSLDLDFDVMVTDLAPIDLVLQRAGRLHRHARPPEVRRGHPAPVLHIAGMQHEDELPVLGVPYYFSKVYDRSVLLRTWALLKRTSRVKPPEDIDQLVQRVYGHESLAEGLSHNAQAEFDRAADALDQAVQDDESDASAVVIGDPGNRTWEPVRSLKRQEEDDAGYFLRAVTRKGEESVTAVPLYVYEGGYALDSSGARPVRMEQVPTLADAKALYMRSVRLSRREVVRGLKTQPVLRSGWDRSPLLRDCYPLILDGVRNIFGRLRVAYTPELGIVYESVTV